MKRHSTTLPVHGPRAPLTLTLLWLALVALFALVGCDGSSRGDDDDDDDNDDASGDADADSDADADGDSDSDADGNCAEGLDKIYVVSMDVMDSTSQLYTFDPTLGATPSAFQPVGSGPLDCPSGGQPFSMTVGRDGYAYVLFVNSNSFQCVAVNRVDVLTGECLGAIPYSCGSNNDFPNYFGMGFVTEGAETEDEELWVGYSEYGLTNILGRLDTGSGALTTVSTNLIASEGPEFTGNQLGELWGFFPVYGSTAYVAQVNKSTGGYVDQANLNFSLAAVIPNTDDAGAWAFAYWGDAFYIFYRDLFTPNSSVYKLKTDGTLSTFLASSGLDIWGAGVSTCAPTVDVE